MDIAVHLTELVALHPRLLWDEIIGAAVAVLGRGSVESTFSFQLTVQDLPDFGTDRLNLVIDPAGILADQVTRLQRTYEASRLVEMAAIAIAGLGLYHGGGHEIRDVALRGSAADYLVDEAGHLLEVAGRSRKSDFSSAWQLRWQRLSEQESSGFYVCVAEFETPAGRLAFGPSSE
jgi:hypothetical protein